MKKEKVIIRTYSAGVHYGILTESTNGEGCYHVTLENSRRIWKWSGANSLSELATLGTSSPDNCNFSIPVKKIKLAAIEIIYTTDEAAKSIEDVALWLYSKDTNKATSIIEEFSK